MMREQVVDRSWLRRTLVCVLWTTACGHHAAGDHGTGGASAAGHGGVHALDVGVADSSAGAGGAPAGTGGRPGLRITCSEAPSSVPIQCGSQTCDPPSPTQLDPCVVACCTTLEGQDRCGVRSTAVGIGSECDLPAVFDPSCDEVVQFAGCCDLKQHKCGIMAGLQPGCVTKSSFVTLPASPKSCGLAADAGLADDAG